MTRMLVLKPKIHKFKFYLFINEHLILKIQRTNKLVPEHSEKVQNEVSQYCLFSITAITDT